MTLFYNSLFLLNMIQLLRFSTYKDLIYSEFMQFLQATSRTLLIEILQRFCVYCLGNEQKKPVKKGLATHGVCVKWRGMHSNRSHKKGGLFFKHNLQKRTYPLFIGSNATLFLLAALLVCKLFSTCQKENFSGLQRSVT